MYPLPGKFAIEQKSGQPLIVLHSINLDFFSYHEEFPNIDCLV